MKALALFSGGLDSILSVCLIRQQKVEVEGVCFTSPFFNDAKAQKAAEFLKIPLFAVDITDKLLALVKSPPHGYGKGANPCIDCHILMIKTAGSLMEKRGADFLVSGEVLGERPKSQPRKALEIIDRESGLGDLLVRPLTAKNLPPTLPEREGWIDRDKLMGIKGRSRKIQLELAERFGVREFPTPSGGCLLTDPIFSRRIKFILSFGKLNLNEVELLKIGRHFRLNYKARVIIGRCKQENIQIERLATPGDIILKVKDYPGPTSLFRGMFSEELLMQAASLTARYSDAPREKEAVVKYFTYPTGKIQTIKVKSASEKEIENLRIENI
ncbi:tRNA 4-thiouridine(8) synthase ThiI [Candidatus Aerophobetes bacterium]|nr:tRNA 4-thiouridine(8) synthase ThiI [Candidatus Aerophobetes bacterium]